MVWLLLLFVLFFCFFFCQEEVELAEVECSFLLAERAPAAFK